MWLKLHQKWRHGRRLHALPSISSMAEWQQQHYNQRNIIIIIIIITVLFCKALRRGLFPAQHTYPCFAASLILFSSQHSPLPVAN